MSKEFLIQVTASGKRFIEHGGHQYYWQPRDKVFALQKRGYKKRCLHRVLYEERKGPLQNGYELYATSDDRTDMSSGNWDARPRGQGRKVPSKYKVIEFNGVRYYKKGEYYKSSHADGNLSLHREIWEDHYGPISPGCHIHHANHDPSDNRIENLQMLTAGDHLKHHANHPDDPRFDNQGKRFGAWVGSEENKRQLRAVCRNAKAWHESPEGVAWHKENGRKSWDSRPLVAKRCQRCGEQYQTKSPKISKYCAPRCREADRRHRLKQK